MNKMNQTEWKTWAKANGFHRITASRMKPPKSDDVWTIQGQHSSFGPAPLLTRRGEIRFFASLDTVHKFLSEIGIRDWQVSDPSAGDLFG